MAKILSRKTTRVATLIILAFALLGLFTRLIHRRSLALNQSSDHANSSPRAASSTSTSSSQQQQQQDEKIILRRVLTSPNDANANNNNKDPPPRAAGGSLTGKKIKVSEDEANSYLVRVQHVEPIKTRQAEKPLANVGDAVVAAFAERQKKQMIKEKDEEAVGERQQQQQKQKQNKDVEEQRQQQQQEDEDDPVLLQEEEEAKPSLVKPPQALQRDQRDQAAAANAAGGEEDELVEENLGPVVSPPTPSNASGLEVSEPRDEEEEEEQEEANESSDLASDHSEDSTGPPKEDVNPNASDDTQKEQPPQDDDEAPSNDDNNQQEESGSKYSGESGDSGSDNELGPLAQSAASGGTKDVDVVETPPAARPSVCEAVGVVVAASSSETLPVQLSDLCTEASPVHVSTLKESKSECENMTALIADTWKAIPNRDWYLLIDEQTRVSSSSLERFVKTHSGKESMAVYASIAFLHSGSSSDVRSRIMPYYPAENISIAENTVVVAAHSPILVTGSLFSKLAESLTDECASSGGSDFSRVFAEAINKAGGDIRHHPGIVNVKRISQTPFTIDDGEHLIVARLDEAVEPSLIAEVDDLISGNHSNEEGTTTAVSEPPPSVQESHPCHKEIEIQQHLLMTTFRSLLENVTHVALVDFPDHSNKGDSAIWVGETILLRRLGIEIVYVCTSLSDYNATELSDALRLSQTSHQQEAATLHQQQLQDQQQDQQQPRPTKIPSVAILFHGGGNFGDLYPAHQSFRIQLLTDFPHIPIIGMPQTVNFGVSGSTSSSKHRRAASLRKQTLKALTAHRAGVTWLARDVVSFNGLREMYQGLARVVLAPDAAFMLWNPEDGSVHGYNKKRSSSSFAGVGVVGSSKEVDILVHQRTDKEGTPEQRKVDTWGHLGFDGLETNFKYVIDDWIDVKHDHRGTWDQKANVRVSEGFGFLENATAIITNRLHGHIMLTLMGRPHVVLNERYSKVANYMSTWTSSCRLARVATKLTQAGRWAQALAKHQEWEDEYQYPFELKRATDPTPFLVTEESLHPKSSAKHDRSGSISEEQRSTDIPDASESDDQQQPLQQQQQQEQQQEGSEAPGTSQGDEASESNEISNQEDNAGGSENQANENNDGGATTEESSDQQSDDTGSNNNNAEEDTSNTSDLDYDRVWLGVDGDDDLSLDEDILQMRAEKLRLAEIQKLAAEARLEREQELKKQKEQQLKQQQQQQQQQQQKDKIQPIQADKQGSGTSTIPAPKSHNHNHNKHNSGHTLKFLNGAVPLYNNKKKGGNKHKKGKKQGQK